jgi:predicted Rossmann fold nucleotide-binding protein DprA/Smf involved in DNA uptake
MSVIRDAVDTWKRRLSELEEQIAPLADEAEQLEAIEPRSSGRRPRATNGRRGAAGRRSASRTSTGRAPRGQNRRLILEAIKNEPKTAGDVAKETGIGRPTVSTTLTKLVSDGAAVKAERGYKAA